MSKDIRDDIFINYYMKKRIMRKTNNPDLLGNIYASKYANWFIPFFKKYNIAQAPFLLNCNTLYQFPDFFTIRDRSFFVADYYLYSYFYDFNYALSDITRNEFAVNLYIKTFIEQAYLKGNIDLSFILCQTSPDLELYKNNYDYKNEILSTILVEKTDLQEAVTFLHEATHFIFRNDKSICRNKDYKEIVDIFSTINPNPSEDFFEECYCDYRSISYILEKTYLNTQLPHEEYFNTLFYTLIYTYTLQFTMACQSIDLDEYPKYMNQEMDMLWLRFGGMQAHIYRFLISCGYEKDVPTLNIAYQNSIENFKLLGKNIRNILELTRTEGEQYLELVKDITLEQMTQYIHDFLHLVS